MGIKKIYERGWLRWRRITGLKKVYKVHQKEKEGLLPALKSLIKRKFEYVTAVDGIDFQVNTGEIRALIGPNGAGKSTTIKMLCGILHPTEGQVRVMNYIPWQDRVEYVRNIGAVFGQKSQLIWELPAIDTFALSKEMYRIPNQSTVKIWSISRNCCRSGK